MTMTKEKPVADIKLDHAHHWDIRNYEPGINRGLCKFAGCGAIAFFPSDPLNKKFLARADELNEKEGNPGQNIRLKKQNEESPVPPKPDVEGLSITERNNALHDYYEQNRAAILADFERMSEKKMRARWGINPATWLVLKARWMPDRFQMPAWRRRKREDKKGEESTSGMVQEQEQGTDPRKWPRELKIAIALEAKKYGVKKVAREKGVPMTMVKAWLMSYGKTKPVGIMPHVFSGLSSSGNTLPDFPAFDNGWTESVQQKWLEVYRDIAIAALGKAAT